MSVEGDEGMRGEGNGEREERGWPSMPEGSKWEVSTIDLTCIKRGCVSVEGCMEGIM